MRILLLSTFGFLACFTPWIAEAQSPELINYQAIARDVQTGQEIVNREVYVLAVIRGGGPNGNILYQESHDEVMTDAFGLFTLQIGGGRVEGPPFSSIDWSQGANWLELSIDIGDGLESFAAMQLVSVPYAFHATTATHVDDADADPTNELITDFSFNSGTNQLQISDAGGARNVDLSSLEGGAFDGLDGVSFDAGSSTLSIDDGTQTFNIDLSDLINDADADPTNELVTEFDFNPSNRHLRLSDAGGTHTVNLSSLQSAFDGLDGVSFNEGTSLLSIDDGTQIFNIDLNALIDDADADPTNELIIDFNFNPSTRQLQITDAGGTHTVNLSSLQGGGPHGSFEGLEEVSFDPATSVFTIDDGLEIFNVSLSALIDDADADPTNELITDFSFNAGTNQLQITDAGGTRNVDLSSLDSEAFDGLGGVSFDAGTNLLSVDDGIQIFNIDLSGLINDADADPTNELITDFSFNAGTNQLQITDAGGTRNVDLGSLDSEAFDGLDGVSFDAGSSTLSIDDGTQILNIDLSALIDDADADPTNELIENIAFNPATNTLSIEEAGNNFDVDLSHLDNSNAGIQSVLFNPATSELQIADSDVTHHADLSALINDADADPTNELITGFSFDAAANELQITDAGGSHTVNLSSLEADGFEGLDGVSFDAGTSLLSVDDGMQTFNIDLSALIEDADADPTNELQTLTEVIQRSLEDGEEVVDMSEIRLTNMPVPMLGSDAATKDYIDNYELSGDLTGNPQNAIVTGIHGRKISENAPSQGDILRYDEGAEAWMPTAISELPGGTSFVSIDPGTFRPASPDGIGFTNMRYVFGSSPYVTVLSGSGPTILSAPINLPHMAELNRYNLWVVHPSIATEFEASLMRKDLMTGSIEELATFSSSSFGILPSYTQLNFDLSSLSDDRRFVDNLRYSYNVTIKFSGALPSTIDLSQNVQIHGAQIRYTH